MPTIIKEDVNNNVKVIPDKLLELFNKIKGNLNQISQDSRMTETARFNSLTTVTNLIKELSVNTTWIERMCADQNRAHAFATLSASATRKLKISADKIKKRENVNYNTADGYAFTIEIYDKKNTEDIIVIGMHDIKEELLSFIIMNFYMKRHSYIIDTKKDNVNISMRSLNKPIFDDAILTSVNNMVSNVKTYPKKAEVNTVKKMKKKHKKRPITTGVSGDKYRVINNISNACLLHGPPGVGKSRIIKWLCGQFDGDIKLITMLLSATMSKYQGDSEKNLDKFIQTAKENQPCILLLDEIDSIGLSRPGMNGDNTSNNNISDERASGTQILTHLCQLLDGLQGLNVIFIGITNRIGVLDPALKRRFGLQINVPIPPQKNLDMLVDYHLNDEYMKPGANVLKQYIKLANGGLYAKKNGIDNKNINGTGSTLEYYQYSITTSVCCSYKSHWLKSLMTTNAIYKYNTKRSTFTFVRSIIDDMDDNNNNNNITDEDDLIICRLVDILYAASRERHIHYLDIRKGINMMKRNFNAKEVMENIIKSHK